MEHEITFQLELPDNIAKDNSPVAGELTAIGRRFLRYPLFLLAAIWPFVLLAPHIPGIPRPSTSGSPWRQELAMSILLTMVLALVIRRRPANLNLRIDRPAQFVIITLGLLVSWTWLSSTWAVTPTASVHLGLQWILYLIFFMVMSSVVRNPRLLHSSLVGLAGIVCVLAIACAIESWFGAPLTDGNLRNDLKPVLRGSGGFGEIMAMAAILFASLSLHVNRRRVAVACGITALLGWLATLQSLERAPFLGALTGLTLLIAATAITRLRSRRTLARLGLLIGAFACVLFLQTLPSLTQSTDASGSTVARLGQNLSADSNTRVRFLYWGVALEMLRAHPLLGVGGNNYETAFPEARARFSADHPHSPLVSMNEDLLSVYAHNEYIQLLAELGLIGFALFLSLSVALAANFWRALKHRRQTLPALGAAGAMLAFAVSSGASGSSFRYFGGGLIFFFAAAIISRVAGSGANSRNSSPNWRSPALTLGGRLSLTAACCLFAVTLLVTIAFSAQATGTVLHGLAQTSGEPANAESYYRASLRAFPGSAPTHFDYGLWLKNQRRDAEAASQLTYAVEHGFNSSICYSYLAGAFDSAGNQAAAEEILAHAVRVYPVSVFLLVRHSIALKHRGLSPAAETEFAKAAALDSRAASGWQQLIENDIDAALAASKIDESIALPGQLVPQAAVFEILQENERRFPAMANQGWRARMRAQQMR